MDHSKSECLRRQPEKVWSLLLVIASSGLSMKVNFSVRNRQQCRLTIRMELVELTNSIDKIQITILIQRRGALYSEERAVARLEGGGARKDTIIELNT